MLMHVSWTIEIEANTPWEAAAKALLTQRNRDSTATVFDVVDPQGKQHRVDLLVPEENANEVEGHFSR